MTIARKLREYLAEQKVGCDPLTHAPTATASKSAQESHVSGHRVAKGVLLKDQSGFLLAVLPASHQIRFDLLEGWLHRKLDLASEAEAGALFSDCEVGAVPAIGAAYGVETVLEDSLSGEPEVFFEGGDHTCLLHVTAHQFQSLMSGAQHGHFSHPR